MKLQIHVTKAANIKLGKDHPDALISVSNLTLVYLAQGRMDEAEKLHVHVMKARKGQAILIPSLAWLTWQSFMSLGKIATAEVLFVKAIKSMQQLIGPQHPQTLNAVLKLQKLQELKTFLSKTRSCNM